MKTQNKANVTQDEILQVIIMLANESSLLDNDYYKALSRVILKRLKVNATTVSAFEIPQLKKERVR